MAFSTVRSRQAEICIKRNKAINFGVIPVNWSERFYGASSHRASSTVFKNPDHRMFKNGGTSFDGYGCGKGERVTRRDKQRKVREERASRINSHGSLSLCALALWGERGGTCDEREPRARLRTHLNWRTGSLGSHTRAAASLLVFAAPPLALATPKESLLAGCTGNDNTSPKTSPVWTQTYSSCYLFLANFNCHRKKRT